ncbi:MAG: phosphoribosylformylglycinamidine cyclo-ligase [Chloroflexi bacterium]|nr:phosphoribosylformylglycinamidine cyclo-ligase [Chloroflexota bacterium]MQC16825.1 phosphoribosylformylglycinamidine cyclo-ligase [Chloroflexota bacterium]
MTEPGRSPLTYAAAGVDLDAREATAKRFGALARGTHGPQVIDVPGAFASFFALGGQYRDPVLVASTDGLGTKPLLHLAQGTIRLAGHDIVNNNVGDLATTGATPLFFLDYIATNGLSHQLRLELVEGIAEACAESGVALIGGETADMPDIYREGDFDIAGFVVGVVERDAMIDGSTIAAGDVLIALPSNGLMTNGYSLAREVWALGKGLGDEHDREVLSRRLEEIDGRSLGEALTAPHPPFEPLLRPVLPHLKGIAHITGGGIPGNLSRILRDHVAAEIDPSTWQVPGLFGLIQRDGNIEDAEMFRTFNMGVGMIAAVSPGDLDTVVAAMPGAWKIGEVIERGAESATPVRGIPLSN